MSGKGAGSKISRGKVVPEKKTTSSRAGLIIRVPRVKKALKEATLAYRWSPAAAVAAAAVTEYFISEIGELALIQLDTIYTYTGGNKGRRLTPSLVSLGIRQDPEMSELFSALIYSEGWVPVGADPFLQLTPENRKRVKKGDPDSAAAALKHQNDVKKQRAQSRGKGAAGGKAPRKT